MIFSTITRAGNVIFKYYMLCVWVLYIGLNAFLNLRLNMFNNGIASFTVVNYRKGYCRNGLNAFMPTGVAAV